MAIFNRVISDHAGDYYQFAGRADLRRDVVADQAEVIQYTPAYRISSAIVAKRVFDIVVASLALAILSPVIIAIALAIKLDDRGPIFFVQERVGLNRRREERRRRPSGARLNTRSGFDRRRGMNAGRPFNIYKFRSMVREAEVNGPALACENDPRVTRLGRFMRKTRIDEIPQFINVIRGDMSIIGPRPERSFFINQVRREVPEFTMRLIVKPGITGLAQVEHGYTKSIDEMKAKLFYDLKYIADLSPMLEIKILFKTVYVVITGKGAC
jgi:lipopolysaccharide/colanic/teichoic acid biosynthesis glycosyltransferase